MSQDQETNRQTPNRVWCLYSDGSGAAPGSHISGIGVVMRSPQGDIQKFNSCVKKGDGTALEAELAAFGVALDLAMDLHEPVALHTDNKVIHEVAHFGEGGKGMRGREEERQDIQGMISCLPYRSEVILTNDRNDPMMLLAHKQANIGRRAEKTSATLRNARRAARVRKAYQDALISELMGQAMAGYSDSQFDLLEQLVENWVEREARRETVDWQSCGWAQGDAETSETLAFYRTNYRLAATYQFIHERLKDRYEYIEDLRAVEMIFKSQMQSWEPFNTCSKDGDLLSQEEKESFNTIFHRLENGPP